MAVTMRTVLRDGTTFVALDGVGAVGLLACIGDAVAVAVDEGPVVLDLTEVLLVSPEAARTLVDKLRAPARRGRLRVV
jgi:hypothetical protein